MNITPTSSVSFTGKWQVKEVYGKSGGWAGTSYSKRFHTYHPDAGELETQIQAALAAKNKQYSGALKRERIQTSPDTDRVTTNIVRLGKRLLSAEKRAELVAEQKALRTQKATLARRLVQIAKLLTLK